MLSALSVLVAAVISPVISALVGRHVAQRVTENELKRAEERALKAESLYHLAIAYLRIVGDWCVANGIADKLPEPPPELGLDF